MSPVTRPARLNGDTVGELVCPACHAGELVLLTGQRVIVRHGQLWTRARGNWLHGSRALVCPFCGFRQRVKQARG